MVKKAPGGQEGAVVKKGAQFIVGAQLTIVGAQIRIVGARAPTKRYKITPLLSETHQRQGVGLKPALQMANSQEL